MKLALSSYAYNWAVGIPGYLPERPMTVFDLLDQAVRRRPDITRRKPGSRLPQRRRTDRAGGGDRFRPTRLWEHCTDADRAGPRHIQG